MTIEKIVANNLRAVMQERDISSETTFAEKCGVSQKTMNNILNGRYALKISTLTEIADRLNLPVIGLMIDVESPSIDMMKAISHTTSLLALLKGEDITVIDQMILRLSEKMKVAEG